MNALQKQLIALWEDSNTRPPFKGDLISYDGCCCAQGQALRLAGFTDNDLRAMWPHTADRETARVLGISVTLAVALRVVNDAQPGAPQDVLKAPEKIFGKQARLLLAFWRHIDTLSREQWQQLKRALNDATLDERRHELLAALAAAPGRNTVSTAARIGGNRICEKTDQLNVILQIAIGVENASLEILGHEALPELTVLPLFNLTIAELDSLATQHEQSEPTETP